MNKTEAIIEFCKECNGDQNPKHCISKNCQLHPFRISSRSKDYEKQKTTPHNMK